jgi:hypothetical protein
MQSGFLEDSHDLVIEVHGAWSVVNIGIGFEADNLPPALAEEIGKNQAGGSHADKNDITARQGLLHSGSSLNASFVHACSNPAAVAGLRVAFVGFMKHETHNLPLEVRNFI